jgi:MFS family permease
VLEADPRERRVALVVTTVGMLAAFLNSSILIISLPDIFDGLGINPLEPKSISFLLWLLMGYLLATSVLVVTFGRLGDQYGRARLFNLGFLIFTVGSIACALVPNTGSAGAWELIILRVLQGIGGAMISANSTAIITDAFPADRRGFAIGVNQVAALAGSFVGLIIGGLLAPWHWRLVFWVSVPIGIWGTYVGYRHLKDDPNRPRITTRIDWWGNLTFAFGLIAILVALTYGIQPYGGHVMGWSSPWVLSGLIGGAAVLVLFVFIERRVSDPMFNLSLFRIRAFSAGTGSGLLAAISRGGLQFMLIIWLQGIWLPLHGYSFHDTPLWAGIYMLPLTVGFLVAGPISGALSDRRGARALATSGLLLTAVSFAGLMLLPADFDYLIFATLLALNGIGSGLFASPNASAIMNAVPAADRGSASGVRATAQNAGMVLSIGIFFSLMAAGLASSLPHTLHDGLVAHGVSNADATVAANLPPVGTLFAAFLGANPIKQLLGQVDPGAPVPAAVAGNDFFPRIISAPFMHGITVVFSASILMILVAAGFSMLRGGKFVHSDHPNADALVAEAEEVTPTLESSR